MVIADLGFGTSSFVSIGIIEYAYM
jgi:hypothetical protein